MKKSNRTSVLLAAILMVAGSFIFQNSLAQSGRGASRADFYDELYPYGQWLNYPSYGQVWRPNVDDRFQPYATDGHWEMTEYGNTWVSDYPWGWVTFHYGRWFFDDYQGWLWLPDYEWAPAWVNWRSGGGYYGWAPLGPGMGIDVQVNVRIPYNHWVFVPEIHICNTRIYDYCVPRNYVSSIYGNTYIIDNYYNYNNRRYASGPHRHDIERVTRNRINIYQSDEVSRRERNNNRYNNNRQEVARNTNRFNDSDRNYNYGRQNSESRYSQNSESRYSQNRERSTRQEEVRASRQQPEYNRPRTQREQVVTPDNQGDNYQRRRGNGDYVQPNANNDATRRSNEAYQQPQPRGNRESRFQESSPSSSENRRSRRGGD
jgi:hypothetical protein